MGVAFAFHLPFAPPFSLTSDAAVSLPSLTFERTSVLFNIAALYATMAASERRMEAEGIKRALGYLSVNHCILGRPQTDTLSVRRGYP